MVDQPKALVHETSISTGTGNFTLVNANGKQSFYSAHGVGGTDKFTYYISNQDASEWEEGTGHLLSATILVRDTVISSSNGGSLVDFTSGVKDVTNDVDSTRVVETDTAQTLSNKTLTSPVLNGSLSGTAFLDEDTMSSDSAVAVASQQSIKAYADTMLPLAGGTMTGNIAMAGSQTVDGRDLSADGSKLDGIEASADVTDATNVDAAGAVMESDFDANTILAADTDDTPAALTVNEQTVVGRLTGGNIAAVAIGISDNNMLQVDGAPNSAEYARFTANGLEGRTEAEFKADFNLEIGTDVQAYNADLLTDAIEFVIDGGGSAITTGVKGDLEIPVGCTISRVTMLADQSGSIVVDIWKDSYANFPPTDADSITASAVPTISTATKSQDGTLTGWTTSISAGDILRFNVDSVTSITRVTIALKVTRT